MPFAIRYDRAASILLVNILYARKRLKGEILELEDLPLENICVQEQWEKGIWILQINHREPTARCAVSISFITEVSIPSSWSDRSNANNKTASMLPMLVTCLAFSKVKMSFECLHLVLGQCASVQSARSGESTQKVMQASVIVCTKVNPALSCFTFLIGLSCEPV